MREKYGTIWGRNHEFRWVGGEVREVAPPTTVLNENEVPEHDMNGAAIEGQEAPKQVPLMEESKSGAITSVRTDEECTFCGCKKTLKLSERPNGRSWFLCSHCERIFTGIYVPFDNMNEGTLTRHGWHADLPEGVRNAALKLAVKTDGADRILKVLLLVSSTNVDKTTRKVAWSDYLWLSENTEECYQSSKEYGNLSSISEWQRRICDACIEPRTTSEICKIINHYDVDSIKQYLDYLISGGVVKKIKILRE